MQKTHKNQQETKKERKKERKKETAPKRPDFVWTEKKTPLKCLQNSLENARRKNGHLQRRKTSSTEVSANYKTKSEKMYS